MKFRLAHVIAAFFTLLSGESVVQAEPQAQGQFAAKKLKGSVSLYPLEVGPIAGLTRSWHPMPAITSIPTGTRLMLRVVVPKSAAVTWQGADPIEQPDRAICVMHESGSQVVSVSIVLKNGLTFDQSCTMRVVDTPDGVRVRGLKLWVDPIGITPRSSNQKTIKAFFGGPVSVLAVLGANHYAASVEQSVHARVLTEPAGFEPLMEWRLPDATARFGEAVEFSKNDYGSTFLEAGPPEAVARAQIEFYETSITAPASGWRPLQLGLPLTFTATTTPSGFEPHVTWLASTKYGSTSSILGKGPSFTVTFDDTFQVGQTAWLGVKANQEGIHQDPRRDIVRQAPWICPVCPDNRIAAEKILPHSGQEQRDEIDLQMRGRDSTTDLAIGRRHLTGRNDTNSIFGPAWSFNYRHTFVEEANGDVRMRNFERIDTFTEVATKMGGATRVWEGGVGRYARLTYNGVDTATLRSANGVEIVFAVETAGSLLQGHVSEIVSPAMNRLQFAYESAMAQPKLLKRRLCSMTESFGRTIQFFYDDMGVYPPGVIRILDFSGREVLYDYNAAGQLLSVRSPTVTSTGGLNDFNAGKTTKYAYVNNPSPKLKNALASIVYPNEQAGGMETRLAWTFVTNPLDEFFGYVKTHTVGNPGAPGNLAAGGTYTYDYEFIAEGTGTNDVAVRLTSTDRRGTITEVDFNTIGNVLRRCINTQSPPLRPATPPKQFEQSRAYNDEGDPTSTTSVLGGGHRPRPGRGGAAAVPGKRDGH